MKISKILLFTAIVLCAFGNAYAEINKNASHVADKFLKSTTMVDLEEGKNILSKTIWANIDSVPDVIDYSKIHESMFKTDVSGVFGYKQLVLIKILTDSGIVLTQKYILIVYKDTVLNKWKVYVFSKSVDIPHQINALAKRITSEDWYAKPRYVYRAYGNWLSIGGKLDKARNIFIKAADLNRANPIKSYDLKYANVYSQDSFDIYVDMMNKIIGKKQRNGFIQHD